MMTVFQAFSQFERDIIVERTKEGLISARARGNIGGRPKVDPQLIQKALLLYQEQGLFSSRSLSKDRCQESNVLSLFKTISIARLITWLSFANPANHHQKTTIVLR